MHTNEAETLTTKREEEIKQIVLNINKSLFDFHLLHIIMQYVSQIKEEIAKTRKSEYFNVESKNFIKNFKTLHTNGLKSITRDNINNIFHANVKVKSDELYKSIKTSSWNIKIVYRDNDLFPDQVRTDMTGSESSGYFWEIILPQKYKYNLDNAKSHRNKFPHLRIIRKQIAIQLGFLVLYFNDVLENKGTLKLMNNTEKLNDAKLFAEELIRLQKTKLKKINDELFH